MSRGGPPNQPWVDTGVRDESKPVHLNYFPLGRLKSERRRWKSPNYARSSSLKTAAKNEGTFVTATRAQVHGTPRGPALTDAHWRPDIPRHAQSTRVTSDAPARETDVSTRPTDNLDIQLFHGSVQPTDPANDSRKHQIETSFSHAVLHAPADTNHAIALRRPIKQPCRQTITSLYKLNEVKKW